MAVRLTAFPKHHHFTGYDLHGGMLDAFLVFPTPGLQPPFDVDLLSFNEVLFTDLGQVAPGDHIEPLSFGMAFTISGVPGSAGGNSKCCHRSSGWGVSHFRVAPQVTDHHYFVQSTTHAALLVGKEKSKPSVELTIQLQ